MYFMAEEAPEGTCQHSRDENSSDETCTPASSTTQLPEQTYVQCTDMYMYEIETVYVVK